MLRMSGSNVCVRSILYVPGPRGKGHASRPCGNHDFYDEQGLFISARRDRLKIITDSDRRPRWAARLILMRN